MTPEHYQRIERLYQAALERPAGERVAFLDEACAGDETLRREVESLLDSSEGAGSFLEKPPDEVAAEMIAEKASRWQAGHRLGHYEISSLLGAGGMGEIYRARDSRLGREVAIKVLSAAFAAEADRLRRFEQEARAAGLLNHPNILIVHDIGTHDASPYIVSELLEGETLRECLSRGALPVEKAIEYALQIARGLTAAHGKGIVHRDLKPENLFVTTDGRVKILDFGLAKLKPPKLVGGDGKVATARTSLTNPGVVMGTAAYMSPEQVQGHTADQRSDIFAFGVILYEMLSGQRPFRGESAVEVMNAILREEPIELQGTNGMIPPALARVIRHCLE